MSVLIEQFGQPMIFSSEPWVILSDIELSIKAKIEKYGTPLKDWNISIYRGILTGCNEAFIIDENKKEELIRKDPKSAEIIRPILRGKDIKRYGFDFANLYLIATHNGYGDTPSVNIEHYPAVKEWLDKGGIAYNGKPYKGYEIIAARADQGDTPYNLRSCAYMDDFNKPKICYSETNSAKETKIAFDTSGFYPDKTCFVLVAENDDIEHIYRILSSDIFTWYMYNTSPLLGDGGISLTKDSVLRFPLCKDASDYKLTESEMNCISESLKA